MPLRHQSFDQIPAATPVPEAGETAVQQFQKLQQELRLAYPVIVNLPGIEGGLLAQIAAYAYEILPTEAMLKDDLRAIGELVPRVRAILKTHGYTAEN